MSIDLGDVFNSLMGLTPGAGSSADARAAMVFTSTQRQLILLDTDLIPATKHTRSTTGGIIDPAREAQRLDERNLTLERAMPIITMAVNPKSVRFTQPKRFVKKDVRNGSVFFHFTNSKGQNNDILTMTFQGNTGNIDLGGSVNVSERNPSAMQSGTAIDAQNRIEQDTGALRKLMVWLNLYSLSREPMIFTHNGSIVENEFRITYVSQVIPQPIDFIGFFSKVIEFEENAAKPNSRDYNFEFTVTRTEPDLDDVVSHVLTGIQQRNALQASETATLLTNTNGQLVTI